MLAPLTAADIEAARRDGELACSFTGPDEKVLLLARGDVGGDVATAIVRIGAGIARMTAPGGFNAIVRGAGFSGEGLAVRVAVTSPATGGGESPPLPATLAVEGDAAPPTVPGEWTCGP